MADENIGIVVTDSVASTISVKLKGIASDARDADTAIASLTKTVAGLDGSNLKTLSAAAGQAASSLQQVTAANNNLTASQNNAAASALNLAAAQKTLSSAGQAGQQANAALSSAMDQLQTTAAQLTAALAGLGSTVSRVGQTSQITGAQIANSGADLQKLLGQIDPTVAALDRLDKMEMQLTAHFKAGKLPSDEYTEYKNKIDTARNSVSKMTEETNKGMFATVGAKRELIVLAHEAVSGNFSRMPGSFMVLAERIGGLGGVINPVTISIAAMAAAFGTVALAIGLVESAMRDMNALVAQFAVTGRDLSGGAIHELTVELEGLPGVSRTAAEEIIKAFAQVRSVGGVNLENASMIVKDLATAMGTDVKKAADLMAKSLDEPTKGAIALDKQLGFMTIANFKAIDSLEKHGKTAEAQALLIDLLSKAIGGLTEKAMTPMQRATDDLGNAWHRFTGELDNSAPIQAATNTLISLINALANMLDKMNQLNSWQPPAWISAMQQNGPNAWVDKAMGAMGIHTNVAGMFAGNQPGAAATPIVGNNTITANTGAQYGQTTKFKTDAAGITGSHKGNGAAENRAAALAKINLQLDNQAKLMNMVGTEADKAQQFDKIQEGLTGRKIVLNEQEIASIRAKINANIDNKIVSQEMNRIYDEMKGPQQTWNATITASSKLLAAGKITQDEYNKAMVKGEEAMSDFADPLRQYNKDITEQLRLTTLTVNESAIESAQQKVVNDLLSKGIDLTNADNKAMADSVAKLKERRIALQEASLAQDAQNQLLANSVDRRKQFSRDTDANAKLLKNPGQTGFTAGDSAEDTASKISAMGLDPSALKVAADANVNIYKTMIDQIKQLQDKGLINEEDATNLRTQVWVKSQQQSLASAESFFGSLTALSTSSNATLARIGKAAAISNTIVKTYESATNAYASLSGIPYVGPALGAAAAAAAIAAGMANVNAIRSQGYMTGGYTGNGSITEPAGTVHGQEFVHTASTTARVGVSNMQALQDGTASVVANSQGQASGTAGAGSDGGSGASVAPPPANNIRVVNVLDPKMVGDFMATPQGEQLFLNTIRKNASSVRQTIQNG